MYVQTLARIIADKLNMKVRYVDHISTFAIQMDQVTGEFEVLLSNQCLATAKGCDEVVAMLTRGALAHEALGHGYHTDMTITGKTQLAQGFANLIEDIRIERLAPDRYPGAARSLREMVIHLENNGGFWQDKPDDTLPNTLGKALMRVFRTQILKQPLPQPMTDQLVTRAKAGIGEDLYNTIEAIARAACYAPSTTEVVEAANTIYDLLKQEEERQKQPPQQPDTNDSKPEDGEDEGGQRDSPSTNDSKPEDGEDEGGQRDSPSTNEPRPDDGKDEGGQGDSPSTNDSKPEDGEDEGGQGDSPSTNDSKPEDGEDEGGQGDSPGNDDSKLDDGKDEGGQGDSPGNDDSKLDDGKDEGGQGDSPSNDDSKPDDESMEGAQGEALGEVGSGSNQVPLVIDENDQIDTEIHDAVNAMIRGSLDPRTHVQGRLLDLRDQVPKLHPMEIPADVRMAVQRLRSGLEEALRAFTEDEDDRQADRGRLNTTRLIQAILGSEREPFTEEGRPGVGISTEIMLMFDESWSMEDLGVEFLQSVLYAAGAVLGSFAPDVQLNLAFFDEKAKLVHTSDRRWGPQLGAKAAAAYKPYGGTQWAQSALPLVPFLAKSRKERKIFLTISDGDINFDKHPSVMKEMIDFGIEPAFLIIGDEVPEGLSGVSCEASQASFIKAFSKALLAAISPEFA